MIIKKHIIIAAAAVILATGFNAVIADNSNSLIQMDVKKSSVTDSVDVTFYTTGEMSNSVVTRKSNNRYVVLLPNVSSSSSVTPGFGGVKDLITDIDVKHVNDGIGGYTKVTFATTKPITIKTYMKKTSPLTQAQKDYKTILAQNSGTKPVSAQGENKIQQTASKPAAETAEKAVSNTVKTGTKPEPALQKTTQKPSSQQQVSTPKITAVNPAKTKETANAKAAPGTKQQPAEAVEKSKNPPVATTSGASAAYVPKMKFDKNGKRLIDLEPRVSHKISAAQDQIKQESKPVNPLFDVETHLTQEPQTNTKQVQDITPAAADMPAPAKSSNNRLPIWILAAGGAVAALGIMYLIFDAVLHAGKKDKIRLQSFFDLSSQNQEKRRRREYYDIVNNDELSWQEKYKLYNDKKEKQQIKKNPMDMSYVTDLSGVKKAVLDPEAQKTVSPSQQAADSDTIKYEFKEKFSAKMQAKISQMEHALAQTPALKEPEDADNEVKLEDKVIMDKISDIKLKSFSKPLTLKETHRTLADEEKKISRNKSYKEGRFVKLKNSPLSVNRRKSTASNLEVTDLIDTGSKYLTNSTNNGEMKMNKENEDYLLTSLNEYLSILDTEAERKETTAGSLAQLKPSSAQAMTRSGVTNPITRSFNKTTPRPMPYMNGLIVKSGYNIDSEKGFYVVNIDGVSALVGRIKDSIFILKKFDGVIDKPIQVRPDDGSVYIVRVGKYKCLVDVSKDKMGTLIEI